MWSKSNNSSKYSFHYDDYFFLVLGKYVLVGSNTQATQYLPLDNEVYFWDFEALKSQKVDNINDLAYCIGGSNTCKIPRHDEKSELSIEVQSDSIGSLSLKLAGWKTINLDLITTGDDDDTDCFHTDVTVDVNISYLKL